MTRIPPLFDPDNNAKDVFAGRRPQITRHTPEQAPPENSRGITGNMRPDQPSQPRDDKRLSILGLIINLELRAKEIDRSQDHEPRQHQAANVR